MATIENYDVVIVGSGSGGGFLSGEIAPYASVLILEAGQNVPGAVQFGTGSPERRRFATQINLGNYFPDGRTSSPHTPSFYAYTMYMDESSPGSVTMQREPRIVGGGSFVNVGAWVRPRLVDWE